MEVITTKFSPGDKVYLCKDVEMLKKPAEHTVSEVNVNVYKAPIFTERVVTFFVAAVKVLYGLKRKVKLEMEDYIQRETLDSAARDNKRDIAVTIRVRLCGTRDTFSENELTFEPV